MTSHPYSVRVRGLVAAATLGAMVLLGSQAAIFRASAATTGPCPLQRRSDETVQNFMKRMITCATDKWSVPGGAAKAICVAKVESGLNPGAVSYSGKYVGLYQHLATSWSGRYDTWTKPEWGLNTSAFNGRTNAIVSVRMAHVYGWSAWGGIC